MPHSRRRYLFEQVRDDLRWSKTVSILGMRQVGKTTLVKDLAGSYFSFDEATARNQALREDWSFLENAPLPIAIDECQTVPEAFSQIKYRVDQSSRPGQFLLTGSVRFLSKKDIRESLTGRTSILELLPMNLSESHNKPLSRAVESFATGKKIAVEGRFSESQIRRFAEVGGLPGICFRRDAVVRERLWEMHLETILSRDIEMIAPTRLGYIKTRRLLTEVMRQSGLPVNQALLAKQVGTSGPTVKRLLMAFESLFLIKQHGSTYYPCDLGLLQHLLGELDFADRLTWLRVLFVELRTQLMYQFRSIHEFGEARTRGGLDVAFVTDIKKLARFAIVFDVSPKTSDKSLKSLTWYKKRSPKTRTIAFHLGDEAYISTAGHQCLPITVLF